MTTETNDLMLELKADVKELNEDGTFTGVASMYDVEDLTGDVIDKGAFRKTISENPNVTILWQHDVREPIGEGTVSEWQNKILLKGKLDIEDDPIALKAYSKLKRKRIKGLSIGFQTVKATFEEREDNGHTRYIRHIQELKLMEVSIVTFPALPQAQVTRVKSTEQELLSRIEQLEHKVLALAATNSTPAEVEPEPQTKANEPPVSPEPVARHSALSEGIDGILSMIPR
jgi:uncharacterized protein